MSTATKRSIVFFEVQNTIMCLCMSAAALLVNVGFLTLPSYLISLVQALLVSNIGNPLLQLPRICNLLAGKIAGGNQQSRRFGIASACLNATANTLLLNTVLILVNVGFSPAYGPAWIGSFPVLEVVSLVAALIASPFSNRVADRVVAGKAQKTE